MGASHATREVGGVARYPDIDALVEQTRRTLRVREYAPRTIRAYCGWVRRFLLFHRAVHRSRLTRKHVEGWLSHLAESRHLSAKSRNQAASALGFLFSEVLGSDVMAQVPRARGPSRAPTLLSHDEVLRLLAALRPPHRLIASLLYGTGMRLSECLALRIKDVDFELSQIVVRDGKGGRDRFAILPNRIRQELRAQLEHVHRLHAKDLARGAGRAPLPGALHRKDRQAARSLGWQFVFPATRLSRDPSSGRLGRYHLDPSATQRAVKRAVQKASIHKRATCHSLRHTFATELLRSGCDIRKVQDLMGHKDIRVTMTYLHAIDHSGLGVRSPLDRSP